MAGACVCALLFAVAPASGVWPTAAACVFNAISVGGWNSLDAISAELYPTSVRDGMCPQCGFINRCYSTLACSQVRSTGFGLLQSAGRLSSLATTYTAGELSCCHSQEASPSGTPEPDLSAN